MALFERALESGGRFPRFLSMADGSIASFTIVTTEASPELATLHARQPAILDPSLFEDWLDADAPKEALLSIVGTPHAGPYEVRPVSRLVNKSATTVRRCLSPPEAERVGVAGPDAALAIGPPSSRLLSLTGALNSYDMSEATAAIRSALEALSGLPAPIHTWQISEGLDSTDDPAVWICAVIDEDTFNAETYHALTAKARAASRNAAPDLWPYISVQSLSEQDVNK